MRSEVLKSQEEGRVTEELGEMFLSMARITVTRPAFLDFRRDWKEEMVNEAVYALVRAVPKFDMKRGTSALSYFATVARVGAIAFLRREKVLWNKFQKYKNFLLRTSRHSHRVWYKNWEEEE